MGGKVGRPKARFLSVLDVDKSKVLPVLYELGPLSITELKRVIYPGNVRGRGGYIKREFDWLRKKCYVGVELISRPAVGSHEATYRRDGSQLIIRIVRYTKPKEYRIDSTTLCSVDDPKEQRFFDIAYVDSNTRIRGDCIAFYFNKADQRPLIRFMPTYTWIEELVGCKDENAKFMNDLLIRDRQLWFRAHRPRLKTSIDELLKKCVLNELSMCILRHEDGMVYGNWAEHDRLLLNLIDDPRVCHFLCGLNGSSSSESLIIRLASKALKPPASSSN